jgi:hypothetical protein
LVTARPEGTWNLTRITTDSRPRLASFLAALADSRTLNFWARTDVTFFRWLFSPEPLTRTTPLVDGRTVNVTWRARTRDAPLRANLGAALRGSRTLPAPAKPLVKGNNDADPLSDGP